MTVRLTLMDAPLAGIVRVGPEASLVDVACTLAKTGHGALIVDTQPIGEVTDDDLIAALAGGATGAHRVCDITRAPSRFVPAGMSLADALQEMIVTGRRSLVVFDDDRPLGVANFADVVGTLWRRPSWLGAFGKALHLGGGTR